MKVQIISKDNGVGLSRDHHVLRAALELAGAEVVFVDWQRPRDAVNADINIFLELLTADIVKRAPRNIYVPNPEWYYGTLWGAILPRMTEVWAKTRDCQRIFSAMHRNVRYSGWTSIDQYRPEVSRYMGLLHVAGASDCKSTPEVVKAMATIPELRLTLVTKRDRGAMPSNIDVVRDPDDETLAQLMTGHMVHLCPSSYEGFGHYINEGRSCGALVITTNAPPMNELIRSGIGAGVAVESTSRMRLATACHPSVVEIATLVKYITGLDASRVERIGAKARAAYLSDRAAFIDFIKQAIAP